MDFVITWVDGQEESWKKKRKLYESSIGDDQAHDGQGDSAKDLGEARYRDPGLLRFWFRGVERYAPFCDRIFLVTDHQVPEWLNSSHPKLHLVNHEDFIPKEYLPTFNSNVIEMFLDRIPDLGEEFVYFNDDMFLTGPVEECDFFREGKPVDMLALQPDIANPTDPVMPYIYLNNFMILSRHFDKLTNMRMQRKAYFHLGYPLRNLVYNRIEMHFPQMTGFYTVHGPYPLCKSLFARVWEAEGQALAANATHRFRSKEDLSLYLLREWNKLEGHFVPHNLHKEFVYLDLADADAKTMQRIFSGKKILCLNDSNRAMDYEKQIKIVQEAFRKHLGSPSSYELD